MMTGGPAVCTGLLGWTSDGDFFFNGLRRWQVLSGRLRVFLCDAKVALCSNTLVSFCTYASAPQPLPHRLGQVCNTGFSSLICIAWSFLHLFLSPPPEAAFISHHQCELLPCLCSFQRPKHDPCRVEWCYWRTYTHPDINTCQTLSILFYFFNN